MKATYFVNFELTTLKGVLQLAVATAGKYGSDGRFILWGVGGTDAILLIVVSSS